MVKKFDKPLFRLIWKRKEKIQINPLMNEREEISIDTTEIQCIMWSLYEQLYATKLVNLGEMGKFLET